MILCFPCFRVISLKLAILSPVSYTHLDVYKRQIKDALDLVGLPYKDKKLFSQYSLGMKQRLAIALAVMHDPELLILDEPINGLDPIGIVEVRSFIRELCDARGKTILISSHILSEMCIRDRTKAGYRCDEIILANSLAVWADRLPDRLSSKSITAEKIATACGRMLLNADVYKRQP